MPSSSLIFVLVVALWAAYLLQHWIKRREALATARSVDRFSEGMRVLQRRALAQQHVMAMEGIGDHGRESLTNPPRTSLRAGQVLTGGHPTSDSDSVEQQAPSRFAAGRFGAARLGGAAKLAGAAGQGGAAKLGSVAHRLSGLNGRQVRGIALLGSVSLLLVTVVLAPFGWAPWWSPVTALLLTAGVVAWLRKAALAAQPAAARRPQRAPREVRQTEHSEHWDQAPTAAVRDSFFDGQAGVETVTPARPARVNARTSESDEIAEGSWQPVAVPPPTYTLKAKAERPAPEPAYQQTPVDQLPFDGLALDEDLEELPSVYRAG